MNTLLLLFLIMGGFGFLFLIVSLFIGDVFDSFDFGFDHPDVDGGSGVGVLDSRVISVFLTAFGLIGAVSLNAGIGAILSLIVGLGSGLVFGGVIFAFGYLLYSQESTSSVSDRDLIGRMAQVTVTIKPSSVGQISCVVGEERVEKLARSSDGEEISVGETVLIEDMAGETFIVNSMQTTKSVGKSKKR